MVLMSGCLRNRSCCESAFARQGSLGLASVHFPNDPLWNLQVTFASLVCHLITLFKVWNVGGGDKKLI